MSSKYSVKLALVSLYCRERSENLEFLFKNMWKLLYFEKAAHYLVPVCWTVGHRNSTEGPSVSYGFTHTYMGCGKFCPPRIASDTHIFFERLCFGTKAENKHCYPHQKLSFQSASDES